MPASAPPDHTTDLAGAPPRVDWRFAILCSALLTVIFAVQNWVTRASLAFGTSLVQQATIYTVWLLLLPLVLRSARKRPLVQRPTRRWLFAQFWIGTGYSLLHA